MKDKNEMTKMRKAIKIVMIISLLLVVSSTSYAIMNYSFIGNENTINASNIKLEFTESNTDIISLENALPQTDDNGKENDPFNFVVTTTTEKNMTLGYSLVLEKIELDTEYAALKDEEVKLYLTNKDTNETLFGPTLISDINGDYILYTKENVHGNDNKEIKDKYSLRVWIDDKVDATNWDENTKLQYKFKIGVKTILPEDIDDNAIDSDMNYTIVYNANGGDGTMENTEAVYNENIKLRENKFTLNGATFLGWSTNKNAVEADYENEEAVKKLTNVYKGQVTLYAVWDLNYQVRYNPNGGHTKYNYRDLSMDTSIDSYNPWTLSNGIYKSGGSYESDVESKIISEEFTITEPKKITFEWAVSGEDSYDYLYYTIYKNGSYSSSSSIERTGEYGDTPENLPYEQVTKTLDPGTYKIEFTYTKDSSEDEGLDAGFVKNIKIETESDPMENSVHKYNVSKKLSKNLYEKEHYSFLGWSKNQDDLKAKYTDEENVKNLTNQNNDIVDLYAIWDVDKYNVNVVVENGKVEISSKQVGWNQDGTFNLIPNANHPFSKVTCSNNQNAEIENNVLTIKNVTEDTICNVIFSEHLTTLREDGTLIINESLSDVVSNNKKHGDIVKSYDALSNSNSYVMNSPEDQPWYNEYYNILNVEINSNISPISTANWFNNVYNIKSGDFTKLDTSNVTDMSYMFANVGNNTSTFTLDLSNWDTLNVTDMSYMFANVGHYTTTFELDLSNWDTPNVKTMEAMFQSAGEFTSTFTLDLSNWDTSNVTDMSSMFAATGRYATTWSIGDLATWETKNITNMGCMFANAGEQTTTFELDLSNWNTSNVTDMNNMFIAAGRNATTWSIGNLSSWDVSNVTNMFNMLASTGENATTWSIVGLSNWNTSNVTNMSQMFWDAGKNATTFELDLSNWDVSNVTDMRSIFSGAGSSATNWTVIIPSKTGELDNTDSRFYGNSSSVYAIPPQGKYFTLAS